MEEPERPGPLVPGDPTNQKDEWRPVVGRVSFGCEPRQPGRLHIHRTGPGPEGGKP